jgi:hypothetical protein
MRLDPLALPPGKVKTCTGSHNCCYMHPRIARLVRSGGCTVCSAIKRSAGKAQAAVDPVEACALYLEWTVEKVWIRDLAERSNTYRHIAKLPRLSMPALRLSLSSPLRAHTTPSCRL